VPHAGEDVTPSQQPGSGQIIKKSTSCTLH
jgi:hypothetical protein